ncbi:fatty acid desaturase family protein [Hellea balneolensis]|uniref:fatty acid desaturase family protein n=1 Tax=Hellea balneolensis TaxID=287478 RepID=UPI00041B3549|nr:fatty acid desaturase family protein [Hellea balneolensis]
MRSDLWGAWLTIHVWTVIIGAMATFILLPNPITFILAFLLIGSRQHGLAILMHDAAHGILFKTKALNEFAGKYLLGAPYGGDLGEYRKYHLKHHRYAQSELDPDLALSAKFPISKASLRRKLIRDITGQTFLRLRFASIKMKRGDKPIIEGSEAFQKSSPWPYLKINAILLGSLTLVGFWWVYFALWLAPLMTWFFVVLRLRNITEHAMTTFDDNPLTHARTTYTNILERIFLGPYWVNYHVEHHAYMFVPCYRLKALHKEMIGHHDSMEIRQGYGSVLKLATTT